ncbi:RNA methyltransferase [Ralstonia solanacearum]|uniref:RNA methyltransferase n=1 Tax=Ralstonia solanacearum TaxID=305 RepID=UPI000BD6A7E4|nr:RNA methyltransferase [Ralstonia solanacearum]MBT1537769.1 RNA methyltransferase [Ralstonia solanacearum]RIJ88000.1 RNA methyltransferase [Ralstonia solanacearum]
MNPASRASETAPARDNNVLRQRAARCRFVLVETSHPGNVGSTARALKTMGFGEPGGYVLVRPREPDAQSHPDAIAMASGADDVLAGARVVDDIGEALAGASLTIALTARPREFGPRRIGPRVAAEEVAALLASPDATVAFVFGNERYGLPNDVVERCHVVTHIPANPAYASLNLSQAVQLIAYEVRMALLADTGTGDTRIDGVGFVGEPATAEQIDGMFAHLERGLVEIGFLDPAQPKKLMPRLRRLFARTQLEAEEVNILRGIAKRMLGRRADDATPPTGAADDCR